MQLGGSFCTRATGADYALLSLSVRYSGCRAPQRRAPVLGDQGSGRAALNVLSAPLLTSHDVLHRCVSGHRLLGTQ